MHNNNKALNDNGTNDQNKSCSMAKTGHILILYLHKLSIMANLLSHVSCCELVDLLFTLFKKKYIFQIDMC